jgi:hypothetical protein
LKVVRWRTNSCRVRFLKKTLANREPSTHGTKLKAEAVAKPVDSGIEVTVTGAGRTAQAIQRMVPAHAHEIEQSHLNGWSAKTKPLPDGVVLTVTSSDPQQVQRIRGLGFIGVMVSGSHHQMHHLAMAKGEFVHSQ